jgi:hypothetical protein
VRNAESIAHALSLKPVATRSEANWNWFCAPLQTGDGASDYNAALAKVADFLNANSAYWPDFMLTGGEAEVVLNHTIAPIWESGDKCFELQLAPSFLQRFSSMGIALRIQGWQGH